MPLADRITGLLGNSGKNLIRAQWDALSRIPGGRILFSELIGRAAPYTGTIHARVEDVRRGFAAVTMPDVRGNRNHLSSLHAVALVNLAELAGNLALAYTMPDDARFIVAGLSIEYLKKARGRVRAIGECPLIESSERKEYLVTVSIQNEQGEEVAKATLRSLVGPQKRS